MELRVEHSNLYVKMACCVSKFNRSSWANSTENHRLWSSKVVGM